MSQGTTQGRKLAPPPQLKTSMDPSQKKNPISSTTKEPHPTSKDPTFTPPASVQHISNHFANLYTNQKFLASLKGSNGISYPHQYHHHHHHPQIDTNSKAKALPSTAPLDSSCITLKKSQSQRGRNVAEMHKDSSSRTKVKEKDKKGTKKHPQGVDFEKALAKQSWKEPKEEKMVFSEEKDLKKAAFLMSKSLELDGLKSCAEKCEIGRPSITPGMKNFGGRRKSFSCSQAELADFFSCSGVKVVAVDMPPFMQIHAVDCARKAHDSLEKFTSKALALTLKKEFDGVYGPAWHCIVGTNFGSFVTHSVGGFMYFSMDHKLYILLFKTTVQKAD